jgi:hypothetical protein
MGPFSIEHQARQAAQQYPAGELPGDGLREANLSMLMDACLGSGVQLGAWDSRMVEWLAGYEQSTGAVIAGLITRAAEPIRGDQR